METRRRSGTRQPVGGRRLTATDRVPRATFDAPSFRSALESVAAVIALITSLSGLAFYFGFVHTQAFYGAMGLDSSALAFSTQDYLTRSFDGFYVPLVVLCGGALVFLWANAALLSAVESARDRVRHVVRASAVGGTVLLGNAILHAVGAVNVDLGPYLQPSSSAIAAALLALALRARHAIAVAENEPWLPSEVLRGVAFTFLAVVGIAGVTVATVTYADAIGYSRGLRYAEQVTDRVDTVVLSERDLGIDGPGVHVQMMDTDAVYRFRYTGLRLILRSGDKYLLVNEGYRQADGVAVLLTDAPGIRLEFGGA